MIFSGMAYGLLQMWRIQRILLTSSFYMPGNGAKNLLLQKIQRHTSWFLFKRFLINHLRKSFPFKSVADYPEEPMEHSYEDYIICFEENEALKKALYESIQLLPGRQKELLMLRFYDNMSYEEIAEKNSLSIRTVYNKIHLALKKLRSFELLQQIRKNNISPVQGAQVVRLRHFYSISIWLFESTPFQCRMLFFKKNLRLTGKNRHLFHHLIKRRILCKGKYIR